MVINSLFVKNTLEGIQKNTAFYSIVRNENGAVEWIFWTFNKMVLHCQRRDKHYMSCDPVDTMRQFFVLHGVKEVSGDICRSFFNNGNPPLAVPLDELLKIKRPNKISYYVKDELYFRASYVMELKKKLDVKVYVHKVNQYGGYMIMYHYDQPIGLIMGERR